MPAKALDISRRTLASDSERRCVVNFVAAGVLCLSQNGCHWRTAHVAAIGTLGSRQQCRTHGMPPPRPAIAIRVGTPGPRQADACEHPSPPYAIQLSWREAAAQSTAPIFRDQQAPLEAEVTKHTAICVVQPVTHSVRTAFWSFGTVPCRVAVTRARTTPASYCTLRTRHTKGAFAWMLATLNGGELVRG